MKLPGLPRLGLEKLWVITVLAGVFVFVNTQPIRPHDFWWHLAIGREIVTTKAIPTVDTYSYTVPGLSYPSYNMFWLADISLYGLYQLGGPALVIFLQSLLITTTYGLLLWLCRKISKSWRIAAVVTLFAVALGINNWNVRPQTISYFLGVIFLVAIYSYRRRSKPGWLAVFPIGMLIWVNSHGSFIIGLVLIGIWVGDELWNLLATRYKKHDQESLNSLWAALISLGLALLVCLLNPRGLGIISYVRTLTANPVVQNLVPEWAPPSFDTFDGILFFIVLMLSASILSISPKRPSFYQLVTFLVFGFLGLKTTRGVIWFGLVMAPVIADHLMAVIDRYWQPKSTREDRKGSPVVNLAFLLILLLFAGISLPWFKGVLPLPRAKAGLISNETPLEATQFLLDERPPGELFHDMGFGSYLIWAAQPEYQVFTDPRIELYSREIWWDYLTMINAIPGWEAQLDRYGINTLMLNPDAQMAFIDALEEADYWSVIYKDQSAVIFSKSVE